MAAVQEIRPVRLPLAGVRSFPDHEPLERSIGHLCQEAIAADWGEAFRQRALSIMFDGMKPVAEPQRPRKK
jgi:hypothetical protein